MSYQLPDVVSASNLFLQFLCGRGDLQPHQPASSPPGFQMGLDDGELAGNRKKWEGKRRKLGVVP